MDRRLARSIAIIVTITALGGLLLADRADRLARQRRTVPGGGAAAVDNVAAAGNPESVRVVAAAVAAYEAERRARGLAPLATRVFAYAPDSTGVLVTLFPDQSVLGQDAIVRVSPDGTARVMVWGR